MEATKEQIAEMLEIQSITLDKNRAEKQFKELPQRQVILEIRQKRQEIQKKAEQVTELLKKAQADVTKISADDERLAKKQQEKQTEIERGEGNFRTIESLSKELDSLAKQRAALSQKSDAAIAALEKVQGVAAQIAQALKALDAKEKVEIASFQQEGTALQKEIAQLEVDLTHLYEGLPADLATEFKKIADRSNGVAIGRLEEGRCGCCRSPFDASHLLSLKAQAPLATCPQCKRLLVV